MGDARSKDGRIDRRSFDPARGAVEVTQPLLRAVLSYAPGEGETVAGSLGWLTLDAVDRTAVVEIRLACMPVLGEGIPGPFGSTFYPGDHFEAVVPRRDHDSEASMMLNLLDGLAPRRFEFDMNLPARWRLTLERDGSVIVVDESKVAQVYIGAPWAFDSESNRVPVRFELEGGRLIQVIGVDENTSFPVLVDPDPDAIFTSEGQLVVETWATYLVPESTDVLDGS